MQRSAFTPLDFAMKSWTQRDGQCNLWNWHRSRERFNVASLSESLFVLSGYPRLSWKSIKSVVLLFVYKPHCIIVFANSINGNEKWSCSAMALTFCNSKSTVSLFLFLGCHSQCYRNGSLKKKRILMLLQSKCTTKAGKRILMIKIILFSELTKICFPSTL